MPSAAFLTRIAALALLSATAFTAHAQDRQLVISDWGYSNEFLIPNLFEPFEQEHDVKIVLETGNAPDRLNRLRIRGGVDLIYLTDVFSQQGIDSESFAPIDPALLSNFDDLYEPAKNPQGDYGPAVTFGQYGIIYDTAKVDEKITSWEDLWRPEFSRAIAMPGFNTTSGPLTVLMAAKRVGVDAFQDPDAAFASMAELEPNILKTYNSGSELTNLFTTGEVYIGLVQDFAFPAIKAAIPTVEWAEVSEGNFRMMNTLNIAARSENVELAHAFIDWQLSPKAQKDGAVALRTGPVNKAVELSDEEAAQVIYGEEQVMGLQSSPYRDLLDNRADWETRWNAIFGQ